MKPRHSHSIPKSERGAAMLAALCLAMVFAICLSSYMALCYGSLMISTRNVMSLHALELAEAGLEKALYAENSGDWSAWNTTSPNGIPTQTYTLPAFALDNGATCEVTATVSGYTSASPLMNSEAVVTLSDGVTTIKRQLQTSGMLAPTFVNAAGATSGRVSFNGPSPAGTLDSYDSSLGSYGAQLGPNKYNIGYSAVVSSGLSSPGPPANPTNLPGVILNSAQVNGYVIGVANNPANWTAGAEIVGPSDIQNGVTIDLSRVITQLEPNQPQYQENVPSTNPLPLTITPGISNSIGTPGATLPTSYYTPTDLTLSGGTTLAINGPVIIKVGGNFAIYDTSQIIIATKATGGLGVSLELHANGSVNIDGGGINNQTQDPERLLVVGTTNPSTATTEMSATADFYGVLDFPNSSFIVNGNTHIYGALVAGSLTFTGSPAIHYDVHLQAGLALFSAGIPNLAGPIYNAFKNSSSQAPITATKVVEVAPW